MKLESIYQESKRTMTNEIDKQLKMHRLRLELAADIALLPGDILTFRNRSRLVISAPGGAEPGQTAIVLSGK